MTERSLTTIAIVNRFGHWFGVGLVVPVLAIFQIDRGLSLTQVGINGLIYASVVAVLEIPTGGLADVWGRRRVYLLATMTAMVSSGVFILARSLVTLAAGFALMGVARALSSGCMDAYFVDAFDDLSHSGQLQRFLGRVGTFVPLSLALGGFLGGMIPSWVDGTGASGGVFDNYSILFAVIAAAWGLQAATTLLLIAPDKPKHASGGTVSAGLRAVPEVLGVSVKVGLKNRKILRLLLGAAAWGIAFAGLEQFWQPFVDAFTAVSSPTRLFGYLTTGYFLVGSLGAVAANLLFRVIGPRYGGTIGALRIAIGALFVILSFTSGIWPFAVIYLALFFLNGINDSPEQALFNTEVPSSARSTLLSFESLFMQLGGGFAAVVWGLLSDHYSIGFSWRIAGVIFGLSGLLYLSLGRRRSDTASADAR